MIELNNLENSEPYIIFKNFYKNALEKKQDSIEAISISSFNKNNNEVESRFVNLKYVNVNEWIFFTNYGSQKAQDFETHDQITALFFWAKINVQIRLKAIIKKTPHKFSDIHFKNRSIEKNALAISSKQSQKIDSYENVIKMYENSLSKDQLKIRPIYWGGFSFKPYYFEFWEGHESRINKRIEFEFCSGEWLKSFLQP